MRNSSLGLICLFAAALHSPAATAQTFPSVSTPHSPTITLAQGAYGNWGSGTASTGAGSNPTGSYGTSNCTNIAESCIPLDASAWLVYNIDSGDILGAFNADTVLRADGLVGAVLVVTALEQLDPTDVLSAQEPAPTTKASPAPSTTTTSQTSSPATSTTPSTTNSELWTASPLQRGQQYTVMEVLQTYVLTQDPIAASIIIDALGGEATTGDLMGATLERIGTEHTDLPDSLITTAPTASSARDMAAIYRFAYRLPSFASLAQETSAQIGGGQTVYADNFFMANVAQALGATLVEGEEGEYAVQAAARPEESRLGVVMLGTKADSVRPWAQAASLLQAAAEAEGRVGTLPEPTAPVVELDEEIAPPAEFSTPASPIPWLMLGVGAVFVLGAVLWWLQRRALLAKQRADGSAERQADA